MLPCPCPDLSRKPKHSETLKIEFQHQWTQCLPGTTRYSVTVADFQQMRRLAIVKANAVLSEDFQALRANPFITEQHSLRSHQKTFGAVHEYLMQGHLGVE
ncbi:hypothetical protein D3C75_1010710 [compost metagenome]